MDMKWTDHKHWNSIRARQVILLIISKIHDQRLFWLLYAYALRKSGFVFVSWSGGSIKPEQGDQDAVSVRMLLSNTIDVC